MPTVSSRRGECERETSACLSLNFRPLPSWLDDHPRHQPSLVQIVKEERRIAVDAFHGFRGIPKIIDYDPEHYDDDDLENGKYAELRPIHNCLL